MGDIVIGNISGYTNSTGAGVTVTAAGAGGAMGFTMGNTPYYADSITVRLNLGTNTGNVPSVQLWTASTANKSAAYVCGLIAPALTFDGASHNFVFTIAAEPLELIANQTYYVVIQNATTGTSFTWNSGSASVTPTGTGAAYVSALEGTGTPTGWSTAAPIGWFEVEGTSLNAKLGILMDSFNNYSDGASFPPAATTSPTPSTPWVYNGQSGSGVTVTTSTTAESAFSATPKGLGVLINDTSTTFGSSTGFITTIPTQNGPLTIAFDFEVINNGTSNDEVPCMNVGGDKSDGGTSTGGIVVLWDRGLFGWQSSSSGFTMVGSPLSYSTWYHVSVQLDTTAHTLVSTITPFGGSPSVYTMSFLIPIVDIKTVAFVNNTGAPAEGEWAIDNVTIKPTVTGD